MTRPLLALVVLLALVALDAPMAHALPGDRCRAAADCWGPPAYCVADSLTSSTGRCVAGKVLP
jgi:hypothetical protein